VQKLKIPVVASGGFADGCGLAAALALGADGINMGTRFIATREAPVHENIKQKLVEMNETQTSLIFRTFRNTARVYTNAVALKVAEIEKAGGGFGDVLALVSGKMQDVAWETGDIDAGMITFGMCGGLINDIPSCEELVSRIVTEAEQIITGRLASIVAGKGD
jgi:nitronate monooxygenase